MGLRLRILRIVEPENGGPRKRRILDAYALRAGADEGFIQKLIAEGALVKYGDKKGARYGLPRGKA